MTKTMTGKSAMFLLEIAMGRLPDGVPTPYPDVLDDLAAQLERQGLLARHWVGDKRRGALLTKDGKRLVDAMAASR